jgi:hypothetical protein
MTINPQSDHEWTIHSLNIHGIFFERWCQKMIRESGNWQLASTNYPVAYKPLDSHWPWKESELDVRAIYGGYQGYLQNRRHLTLLVECKKHNPEFIEWIFFQDEPRRLNYFPCVETQSEESHINEIEIRTSLLQVSLDLPIAYNARETRGTYQEYQAQRGRNKTLKEMTKTTTDAIDKATYQIALATQAVVSEEVNLAGHFGRFNPEATKLLDKHVFLPAVLTTANLFLCEFEDKSVDGISGEIPYDKASLTPTPFLVYRMSLPSHLHRKPEPSVKDSIVYGSHEVHTRMDILIVHSEAFGKFLQTLPDMISHAL